jgi:hypothetical protein
MLILMHTTQFFVSLRSNHEILNIFGSYNIGVSIYIIQGDLRIVSDLAHLFLQHKLLSHRIFRCFSI